MYIYVRVFLHISTSLHDNAKLARVGVARAAPAHGLTELFLIKYFALLYVRSNITLHDPFLRIIIWTTWLLYCIQLCTWLMTAFGLSICLVVKARKGLKSLPTMPCLKNRTKQFFKWKTPCIFPSKNSNLTWITYFALLYAQILHYTILSCE